MLSFCCWMTFLLLGDDIGSLFLFFRMTVLLTVPIPVYMAMPSFCGLIVIYLVFDDVGADAASPGVDGV